MVKQSEFVSYVKSLVGSRVDQDGYYGSQCVDLIMHVNEKYFGMRTWGNAIDYNRETSLFGIGGPGTLMVTSESVLLSTV